MLFVYLFPIFCSISYKINRIAKGTDTSSFIHIADVKSYKFYMEKDKELYETLPLPQQVQKLMHLPELQIQKGESVYLIKPLQYFVIPHTNYVGEFEELTFENKCVVCYYTDNNIIAKVIYQMSQDEPKIEKFFAGEASLYVFKVTGNFIGDKRDCRIIHYLHTQDSDEVSESTIGFLEQLKMNLQEMIVMSDTDEKREEL